MKSNTHPGLWKNLLKTCLYTGISELQRVKNAVLPGEFASVLGQAQCRSIAKCP
jgi:hypothetical protein